MQRMRILLTNDDGIHADGIRELHAALEGLGEILVVAPLEVQSGTGHGVTFDRPLFCEPFEISETFRGYAVDGRPADCVKVALGCIWPDVYGAGSRPDLTISGLNMGSNSGVHVIYSGTVAAAVESAFYGIPAIAASQHFGGGPADWERGAWIARQAIDRVLEGDLVPHGVVNINVPLCERADHPMPEIRVAPHNTARCSDHYERRASPRGRTYYWLHGDAPFFERTTPGSDVDLLEQGYVTVTPLRFDLTDASQLDVLEARFGG